jgi:hypothetical protein
MDDKNNNSDSEGNPFDDSLGLFDDFFGLSESDETPDVKEKQRAPDTSPEKPVQQDSSQNPFDDKPDLFGDLNVAAGANKTPVSKKGPAVTGKRAKAPTQKKPSPQKPEDKKPIEKKPPQPVPPKQSKPAVKKDIPVPEEKSPEKETAKKVPQKVSPKVTQKKQKIIPEKKPPAKEIAPRATSADSKPAPGKDISIKEPPDMEKTSAGQETIKIKPEKKSKKAVNTLVFALSIILLVILSMFTGKIMDFDTITSFLDSEDSQNSFQEPVPTGDANKKKEVAAPKEDSVETKTEQKIESKGEISAVQVKDTIKEKEEMEVKTAPFPSEKPDRISGIFKKKILSFPYSVYLGSYSGMANVTKASSDYEEMGISCYWIKLDLGDKGVWYRLFTGYFKTREEADEFIETSKMQGAESKITKYANLIGTFTDKEDIEKYKNRLEEKGYSPYIINDAEDTYQLYTGAFYQKNRAEEQNSDLALDGIESELVER